MDRKTESELDLEAQANCLMWWNSAHHDFWEAYKEDSMDEIEAALAKWQDMDC